MWIRHVGYTIEARLETDGENKNQRKEKSGRKNKTPSGTIMTAWTLTMTCWALLLSYFHFLRGKTLSSVMCYWVVHNWRHGSKSTTNSSWVLKAWKTNLRNCSLRRADLANEGRGHLLAAGSIHLPWWIRDVYRLRNTVIWTNSIYLCQLIKQGYSRIELQERCPSTLKINTVWHTRCLKPERIHGLPFDLHYCSSSGIKHLFTIFRQKI